MKVMVVDNGARAHALAETLARTPDVGEVFVSPGNAGTDEFAVNTGIHPLEVDELVGFAKQNKIDLSVISADDPLSVGAVDAFQTEKLGVFGPTQAAAKIEWSKVFAKQLAAQQNIPTATFGVFSEIKQALSYVNCQKFPLFVKQDKLAQGKGVERCNDVAQVEATLRRLKKLGRFGTNNQIVIESALYGPEISLHAWCDGEEYRMFPFAMQDHKTIHENDEGPMTGGMGVIAPVPHITEQHIERLGQKFVAPVLRELYERGTPFKGILYPGLILTEEGPQLIEYNARPGDPETQIWASLFEDDLADTFLTCMEGDLPLLLPTRWRNASAACIVLASEGYPNNTQTGAVIEGLENLKSYLNIRVFHGATEKKDGNIVTSGGRALSIVSVGGVFEEDLEEVIERTYRAAEQISFDGKEPQFRLDIGDKALSPALKQRVNTTQHLF